jgi:signal transduction histidine kinase
MDSSQTWINTPPPARGPAKRKLPSPRIRWYESWIIRTATVATLTLGAGYGVSAYFTFESIRAIANLAHDTAIEKALGDYLEHLKSSHTMRNELISAKLGPYIQDAVRQGKTSISQETLSTWLKETSVGSLTGQGEIKVQKTTISQDRDMASRMTKDTEEMPSPEIVAGGHTSDTPSTPKPPWSEWIDRDHLRLLNLVLEFPRGPDYETFKVTEDLRQRYQMVGVRLEEEIRPALVRASLVTLIVTFMVLIGLLILLAQRFKARLSTVIEGFSFWSEQNSSFRFHHHYRGELKLITRQFNTMADEVDANKKRSLYLEKIASWQVIARKLAHEIKNPLTPIQMMVSQLKRRYKGDDLAFASLLDEAQSIISEEIQSLRRMVDDFAQFAKLPEPRLKDVDIIQLCRRAVDLQKNAYPKHEIKFTDHTPNDGTTLFGRVDDDLLRQVLINLIKNAAEASLDRSARIDVRLAVDQDDLVIEVHDDGPGIPPEHLTRIFEAYFTTKHTGPTAGMGLGLAVCQKIVMDHRGQLHVKSTPGSTSFSMRLPRHTS